MSHFQVLINKALINTKHVESAAVLVAESGNITAVSSNFEILSEEAQMFTNAFKCLATTREQGLFFKMKAFTCVRADEKSIYCKYGHQGLILVKTAVHVIVATYSEGMLPSVCVEAAEKLAEYLRGKGK